LIWRIASSPANTKVVGPLTVGWVEPFAKPIGSMMHRLRSTHPAELLGRGQPGVRYRCRIGRRASARARGSLWTGNSSPASVGFRG
jgi:hypothetical protein